MPDNIIKPGKPTAEQLAEMNARREQRKADKDKWYGISALKQQLAGMDYMTSKHADGEYTEAEWKEIVKKRKELREAIRELEKE